MKHYSQGKIRNLCEPNCPDPSFEKALKAAFDANFIHLILWTSQHYKETYTPDSLINRAKNLPKYILQNQHQFLRNKEEPLDLSFFKKTFKDMIYSRQTHF